MNPPAGFIFAGDDAAVTVDSPRSSSDFAKRMERAIERRLLHSKHGPLVVSG